MGASPRTRQRQAVERSRRVVAGQMTEAQFQRTVIDLARLHEWMVAHFRAASVTRRDGSTVHMTPVEADGAGFPDLVLVHPLRGTLFRELKTDRGRISPHQQVWIARLEIAGADVAVWRPADWSQIATTLTGRTA